MNSSLKSVLIFAALGVLAGCGPTQTTSNDAGVPPPDAGVPVVDAGPTCAPGTDADGDGVCDADDRCAEGDDHLDADHDGVPDACDRCNGHDDLKDADGDGIGDACDVCPNGDDKVDTDGDGIPDHCDVCPNDVGNDSDGDGVCDSADMCPGHDDHVDTDHDGVPDGCDACPTTPGSVDSDGDGVCDEADQCPNAPDGWGTAGLDLDRDGIDDGCDACAGDNSMGDDDGDGACNSTGTDDACPGVDDFSSACPDLPWRGGPGGDEKGWFRCPTGAWGVGVEVENYSADTVIGARLICKDAMGNLTYVGAYGSGNSAPSNISHAPYEIRCDDTHADGRLIGQIYALDHGTNPQDIWMGRVGVICLSDSDGVSWEIDPPSPAQTNDIHSDFCTGHHESVTGIHVRTGWWCDGLQMTCTSF